MRKYFKLLKSNKRFRIFSILGLLSFVVFLMVSHFSVNYQISKTEEHELTLLKEHYRVQFELIDDTVYLIDSYFDSDTVDITQYEFIELIDTIVDDNIEYVAVSEAGIIDLVYPQSDYNGLVGTNILDDTLHGSQLVNTILDDSLIYQYDIDGDDVSMIYIRKPIFIDDNYYGFITIALNPNDFISGTNEYSSENMESGIFTSDGNKIHGVGVLTDYELSEIELGSSTLQVGGRVTTDYKISMYLESSVFLIVVTIVTLMMSIYIYKGEYLVTSLSTELDYRKNYDHTTGLFNIERLYEDVEQLINTNETFYIAFMNIHNIKFINEKFGYYLTSELLKKLTGLIERVLRNNATMYSYGGDEYVIVVKTDTKSEVTNLLRRISKIFDNDISSGNIKARLGLSIGIVEHPIHGGSPEQLIKNAHLTSSQISRYDKDVFRYYESDKIKNVNLTDDFDKMVSGLNLELFEVFLMPIVDVKTNEISGFECLSRSFDDFGNVLPTEDVVLSLERNGRIQELDEIVFKKMLKIMKRINKEFPEKEFFLSLNASALSVNDEYVDNIITYYKQSRLKKGQIVIELTESYQVEDYDYLIRLFNKLNDNGIKVAIDDFGSGYSSISYISKFPIYAIKVDKQYVRDYQSNQFNKTLLMTLKSIAEVLKCKLVAEGVDSIETLEYLNEVGCPFYQGYYFSKGVTLQDAFALIKNNIQDEKE